MRRNLPYISSAPLRQIVSTEPIYQAGKFQQVRYSEKRPLPAKNDLGIWGNNICPLWPNRENCPIAPFQQQGPPISGCTAHQRTVAAALRGDEKDASPAQNVFLGSESVHSWVRYKRLERGRFIWPKAESGTVSLSRAQLSMLLEGIDWRRPERTFQPQIAV
jgi:hypothetical protein